MNKKMALLVTLFFALISLQMRAVSADFNFTLPHFPILLPSATPTPAFVHIVIPTIKFPLITLPPLSPSSTPIPPSATPIPATATSIPPTVTEAPPAASVNEEMTAQDAQAEGRLSSPPVTPSLIPSPSIYSPTPQVAPQKEGLTQMEIIFGGIGGVFGIVILVLLWPKVKQFIHDKTA